MATILKAHHQWATRPSDERFLSLPDMLDFKVKLHQRSETRVLNSRAIEAVSDENDIRGLSFVGVNGAPVAPSNWAFGQIARLANAPPAYLRDLPGALAADNINYGLLAHEAEDVMALTAHGEDGGVSTLSAITSPTYGRVWDMTMISSLIERFGDGVTGAFRVPGEFGKKVPVTRQNTTLYAGDRDMFVFLADEENRIEVGNRRGGQGGSMARGFFVWNSEVGRSSFGIATFLFDYVCSNRIVWGAEGYREIKVRHTSGAPDKWIEQAVPAIEAYSKSSAKPITDAIQLAQAAKLPTPVEEFLMKKRQFSKKKMEAIVAAHQADEGRPMETIFDVVTGVTALARSISQQDLRVELEREAGKIMDLAAA